MSTILKRLRLERGLSSRALGRKVGVSHVTITRLERGISQGHPSTRAELSRVLGVPIDILLLPDTKNAADPKIDGAKAATSPATTPEFHHGS
jgi:transcriptional regulator with XRE-family HTH domain